MCPGCSSFLNLFKVIHIVSKHVNKISFTPFLQFYYWHFFNKHSRHLLIECSWLDTRKTRQITVESALAASEHQSIRAATPTSASSTGHRREISRISDLYKSTGDFVCLNMENQVTINWFILISLILSFRVAHTGFWENMLVDDSKRVHRRFER